MELTLGDAARVDHLVLGEDGLDRDLPPEKRQLLNLNHVWWAANPRRHTSEGLPFPAHTKRERPAARKACSRSQPYP